MVPYNPPVRAGGRSTVGETIGITTSSAVLAPHLARTGLDVHVQFASCWSARRTAWVHICLSCRMCTRYMTLAQETGRQSGKQKRIAGEQAFWYD